MERIIDYDPLTGTKVTFDWADGKMAIGHHYADPEGIIESNQWALGDIEQHRAEAKGDTFAHYAKIPFGVIAEWKEKHGVDFFNPDHMRKVMSLLNTDYKKCKRTTYNHDR